MKRGKSMSTKGSMSKQVWLVAIVFTLVGFLLGLLVGTRGLLPINPGSSEPETVQKTDNAYIGTWKFVNGEYTTLITIREDGSVTEDELFAGKRKSVKTGVLKTDGIAYTKRVDYQFSGQTGYTDVIEREQELTEYYTISLSEDGEMLDILLGRNGAAGAHHYFRVTE